MRLNLLERTLNGSMPVNLSDHTLVQINVSAEKKRISQVSRLRDEPAVRNAYPERALTRHWIATPCFGCQERVPQLICASAHARRPRGIRRSARLFLGLQQAAELRRTGRLWDLVVSIGSQPLPRSSQKCCRTQTIGNQEPGRVGGILSLGCPRVDFGSTRSSERHRATSLFLPVGLLALRRPGIRPSRGGGYIGRRGRKPARPRLLLGKTGWRRAPGPIDEPSPLRQLS